MTPPTDKLPTAPGHDRTDHEAPVHRHMGLALVVICVAQLMVVLDASIVNIALPSIQRALRFSAADLIWVINGYTLAFGGLLLLGGRTGDVFGRRRMFIVGVAIFTTASLLGGMATTEAWLIAARVIQGVGGAIAAPTALALIASTFPEGGQRNRAMGVYAGMSGAGAAIGVLLGGILTSSLGWRWVLFVNVPIGLAVMVAAPRVLSETETRRGRLDLPGALTATVGMTLLVFGLLHAATTSWSNQWTAASLVAGIGLLGLFVLIEARSRHALMPLHLFKSRNRSTAYTIMLAIGTAMFSMFFFLTLFVQDVLGYGPMKAGVCYLPFALTIVLVAGVTSQAVGRTGTKPPLVLGTAFGAGGLFWFSQATAHTTYLSGLLGPMLVTAAGMAMCFVPLTLSAVAGVRRDEQGIASALLNSGQQVGGSLGLAVLGTIAVETTRNRITQVLETLSPTVAHTASRYLGSAPPPSAAPIPPGVHAALTSAYVGGYTTAFAVGSGIMAFAFVLAAVVLRPPAPATATAGAIEVEPALT
ncbi:MAG TPA: MFS transporter [Acidimicrobiales bacterium]|nr:MFS transporter [Acidimicrobiales bacterium]